MKLASKLDGAIITIRRSEYYENYHYWRANYTDVTPARTPKQDRQAELFRMLGDLRRFEQMCYRFNHILAETSYKDYRINKSDIIRAAYQEIEHKLKEIK